MTRDEILNMPAGQRLNMQVAETIFHWQEITDEEELNRLNGYVLHPPPKAWWLTPGGERRYYPPDYSQEWGGVQPIVTAMLSRGKSFALEYCPILGWTANFSGAIVNRTGEGVASVICKSALISTMQL